MRNKLFFVLVCIMFLVGCNSKNRSKDESTTTIKIESSQEDVDTLSVEAIDDSGEAIVEDTVSHLVIDTISESNTNTDQE